MATHLEISQGYLSDLISGKKKAEKWERIVDFANKLGMDPTDLMDGIKVAPKLAFLDTLFNRPSYTLAEYTSEIGMNVVVSEQMKAYMQGGEGMTAAQEMEDRRFVIIIDSTEYEPVFTKGEIVLIDPDRRVLEGDICLIVIDNQARFRRLVSDDDREVRFSSLTNEIYQNVMIKGSAEQPDVRGRVMGAWRDL